MYSSSDSIPQSTDDLKHGHRSTIRFGITGAVFGLLFPIVSTYLDALFRIGSVAPWAWVQAQQTSVLHLVIDTAPIFLGFIAALAGRRQDLLEASFTRLQSTHDRLQTAHEVMSTTAEELGVALEAKGQFLAKMSHELRTPLNVVIGFSRILIDRSSDKLEKRAQRHLKMVHESGEHLLSLVNDMLDLERIAAGRLKVHKGEIDAAELLRSLHEALKPQADAGGYTFEIEGADDELHMDTDPDRLRQVLSNLTNNAIKYAGEGTITLGIERQSDGVRFFVRDTGAGMPKEQLAKIFEPFHQIDNSTTRGKDGAGLGLSIVQLLVELLGGAVTVESTEGEGSTFYVQFPASAVIDAEESEGLPPETTGEFMAFATEPAGSEIPEDAPRVLVIDDKRELLELVHHELREAGFRVDIATNGKAGLAAAKEKRPDAIVLDIVMPGMDGWEVLRRLRADPELSGTPVIISSMLDNEPRAAADFAVAAWLTKPFDAEELRKALQKTVVDEPCDDVLIIEDDEGTRSLLSASLSEAGVDVRVAANGAEAAAELDNGMPCAVVLDLGLPDVSGFEVLRELRARTGGDSVPIVVYTGRDLSEEEAQQLRDGLTEVIEKHAARGVDGVVETIRHALAGGSS